jgi:hypothetical protein
MPVDAHVIEPPKLSSTVRTGVIAGIAAAMCLLALVVLALLVRRCLRRRRAGLRKAPLQPPQRAEAAHDSASLEMKRALAFEMLRTRFDSDHQERINAVFSRARSPVGTAAATGQPVLSDSAETRPRRDAGSGERPAVWWYLDEDNKQTGQPPRARCAASTLIHL